MRRRRGHRRLREAPELDITAFLNLMVVLVPFLLVSAVFSRITILELSLPANAGDMKPDKPKITIEVIVRDKILELSDGRRIIARFPKIPAAVKTETDDLVTAIDSGSEEEARDQYDLLKLSKKLLSIKAKYPDKLDASVLMEPDIEYDYLVQVMDAVRSAEVVPEGEEKQRLFVLFPEISIGDAP